MPAKRSWRKLVKKEQRRRRRQNHALVREEAEVIAEKAKEADPEYQAWLKQQAEIEDFQRVVNERLQKDEEDAWLRREALAQRQFQVEAANRAKQEAECERLRAKQAEELAAQQAEQRKRREESKRLTEQAAAEFEAMMQRMHEYMEDTKDRSPPVELRRVVETRPTERLCEFYTRTNCCRYGHSCTHNHRRPMLAKILLIRHFFTHPLLQPDETHKEYANADANLELTQEDLGIAYDEFFRDAVDELEKFGKIINFRTVRNTLPHLRGHVFVEYAQERVVIMQPEDLMWSSPILRHGVVPFAVREAHVKSCLSLARKCPKGNSCGYLHLFRNPNNLFNSSLELYDPQKTPRPAILTPRPRPMSWNDNDKESRKEWRWSESPEVELKPYEPAHKISKSTRNRCSESKRDRSSRSKRYRSFSRERDGNSRSERDTSSRSGRDRSSSIEFEGSSRSYRDRSSRSHRDRTSKLECDTVCKSNFGSSPNPKSESDTRSRVESDTKRRTKHDSSGTSSRKRHGSPSKRYPEQQHTHKRSRSSSPASHISRQDQRGSRTPTRMK